MEVKINKEIRSYTESIFFGLSMRQCIFSALACGIAVLIYQLAIEPLGMEVTSWLCILGALPFAALGFIKYQHMNTEELIRQAWYSFLLTRQQLDDQPFNLYVLIVQPVLEKDRKESLVHDKKLRKIKKAEQRKIKSS